MGYVGFQNGNYIPLTNNSPGYWMAVPQGGASGNVTPNTQFGTLDANGNITPYGGDIYSSDGGGYSLFRNSNGTSMAPVNAQSSNSRPSSNWSYRPSNQYQQYYTHNPAYGRSPLSPFVPQGQTNQKPSAASLIAQLGRSAPVGKARGGIVGAYADGGRVNDIMQILSGLGFGRMPMSTGGAVRGVGGGQEDNILTNVASGSFIIPADVMSDLGDGNTQEGHRRWDEAESRFRGSRLGYARGGSVPVALSAGERQVSPEMVSAFGGGSNERGTAKLKELIKMVRAHKATKNHPPKAKSPLSYMGMKDTSVRKSPLIMQ